MRKTATLLILLLVVVLAAAGASPLGLPEETLLSGPAQISGGDVIAAENHRLASRLYTLRDGVVTQLYEEFRIQNGKESAIVRVAADKKNVYFLRSFADGMEWELLKLENGEAVSRQNGALDERADITGLTVQDEEFWITAMHDDGTISVYEYAGANGGLKMLIPAQWVEDVVTASYDGTRLNAVTKYEETCIIAQDGSRTYSDAATDTPANVVVNVTGWLLCKRTVLVAAAALWLVVALSILITSAINRSAVRLAGRLTAVGGEIIFLMLLATMAMVSCQVLYFAGLLKMLQALCMMAVISAGILLVSILILRITAGRITKPLRSLVRQMNEVADGRVDFCEVTPGRDELNRLHRAMQEMCMSLSVRNYELESTVRSYQRFVPEKLTKLLDRASVAEVNPGDSSWMTGNIGLFSVGNREEARDALEDDAFVEFINHSLSIFQECLQDNHGSMISSGLRLSTIETLFSNAAADGVQAGLDFLGKTQKKTGEEIPAPQPFLILHRASFLYGVAGQEDRLFPYLSSGEMEFLGGFAPQLQRLGTRIVMTENYLKQMNGGEYTTRYIGFVADEERGAYKLYEVLDAYPELEKKVRIGYDRQFQEAIALFYRNDFFLARNLFSALLRECPEDGVVRWYLFACEHYFHQEGSYEANYQLFGIQES